MPLPRRLAPFASLALFAPFALLLSAFPAGCDSQAPPDYRGEPLGTIRGTIIDASSNPPEAPQVVLLWHHEDEEDRDAPVGVETQVSGDFPASFRLDLFEPPPEDTLGALDGLDDNPGPYRVAEAYLMVYPQGTTEYTYDRAGALSWEERYTVIYAAEDVPAGEVEWGVDVPRGYSLKRSTLDGIEIAPIDTPLQLRLVDDTGILCTPRQLECDPDQGGALATIHGTVTSEASNPPPAVEVRIGWHVADDDIELPEQPRATAEGYPAPFSLDVYAPPAVSLTDGDEDGYRVAYAFIELYPAGTTTFDPLTRISWDEHHMLVYAEEEIPAEVHGFVIPQGMGLIRDSWDTGEREMEYFPIDTEVAIRLVDDKGELGHPN